MSFSAVPGMVVKIMHVLLVLVHEGCYIVKLHLQVHHLKGKKAMLYSLSVT